MWAATYGEAFVDPENGRPNGDISFPPHDQRRPRNHVAIGPNLPDTLAFHDSHRSEEGTIQMGQGVFGPVTRRMWDYDVGGMNVIKKWLSYRTSQRHGRRTSPLDDITFSSWPREWVTEFNQLLTALRRVSDLEPDQSTLLTHVLSGPIITTDHLRTAGVKTPTTAKDRKPRYDLASTGASTSSAQDTLL